MNKDALKWWNKLLKLYFSDSLVSEEWRARVQQLFADEIFEEEKSAVLEKYFYKIIEG